MSTSTAPVEAAPAAARHTLRPDARRRAVAGGFGVGRLCWFVVIGGVLPIIVSAGDTAPFSITVALIWIITLHSAAGLAIVLTSRTVMPMHLGFWAYCYLFFGLAPLAQVGSDTFPNGLHYPGPVTARTALLVELGMAAFTLGSFLAKWHRRRQGARDRVRRLLVGRELSTIRVIVLCLIALLIAAYAIPKLGGLHSFFTSRQAATEAAAEANPSSTGKASVALTRWGVSVPALFALLGLLHAPGLRRTPRAAATTLAASRYTRFGRRLRRVIDSYDPVLWTLLIPIAVINIIVNNPISQPRFWAGTVLFSLVFVTARSLRPKVFRALAMIFLVLFVVAFPYASYFRYTKTQAIAITSVSGQFQNNLDYDSFAQTATGIEYFTRNGLDPSAFLGEVGFWVPRSVWPDKPQDTGVVLSQWVGYTLLNRSAPLWIEGYQWGGYPLVGLLFLGIGWLWRRIDGVLDSVRAGRGRLVHCMIPVLAFFQIIVLRGSLLQATAPLVLILIIPVALTVRARRKT